MIASWPDRLLAVPVRIFYFYLAALAEDPPATVAVSLILLSLIAGIWLLPRTKRWVDRRLDAHHFRADDTDSAPDRDEPAIEPDPDAEQLAELFELRPTQAPPARHDHRTPPGHPAARRTRRHRTRI